MSKPCQFCSETRAAAKQVAARVVAPVKKAKHKLVDIVNRKRKGG